MKKDPVCGSQVDEKNVSATSSYQGQRYAFCGSECTDKFDKNPERYAHGKAQEGSSTQSQGKQHEHQPGKQQEHQMRR